MNGRAEPWVRTSAGDIRGTLVETPDGAADEFLGIQYASIPARFEPSTLLDCWHEPVTATSFGPIAPQSASADFPLGEMSEEHCLNLNIWACARRKSNVPVLVWVHGGLHISGSNSQPLHHGARLAAFGEMIVVSVNYRLGALGHLPLSHVLGDEYRPASNLALTDVITSLNWVQRFISDFGGDPNNVTLAGQSAGGVVVSSLMAAPRAAGLFRRAIIQSADVERPAPHKESESVANELLHELGVSARPEGLLSAPWQDLISAQERLISRRNEGSIRPVPVFPPFIDGEVLRSSPTSGIAEGMSCDVELLIGTNANEATAIVDVDEPNSPALRALLEHTFRLLVAEGRAPQELIRAVDASLAGDGADSRTFAQALEMCLTEDVYRGPTRRFIAARAEAPGATRSYLFNWAQLDQRWSRGSGHSLEVPFIFRHIDDSTAAIAEVGRLAPPELRDEMSSRWCEFIREGASGPLWATEASTQNLTVGRYAE